MINDKDIHEINKKVEEVVDILSELPYFESTMILEITRDTLRMMWMADCAKEVGRRENDI